MLEEKIIAEGKTKIIVDAKNDTPDFGCSTCKKVRIISKDDITAGDGSSREILAGKAEACNTTAVNVFKLLKLKGIPTHFLKLYDERSFLALHAEMIPLEVVTRRIATGSYLKRNPNVTEGYVFDMLEYELFYKNDAWHDPIAQFHPTMGGYLDLYKADQPTGEGIDWLESIELLDNSGKTIDFDQMRIIALQVFLILEDAWSALGLVLWDLKIEFGLVDDGLGGKRLVVADVINNDEWRLREVSGKQLDKQVFRDAVRDGLTDEVLGDISDNYIDIAKLSAYLPQMARI